MRDDISLVFAILAHELQKKYQVFSSVCSTLPSLMRTFCPHSNCVRQSVEKYRFQFPFCLCGYRCMQLVAFSITCLIT